MIQRAYRSVSGTDETARQLQLALDAAEDICLQVVTQLKEISYSAICQAPGTTVYGDTVFSVDGEFTNISEGNRLRRMLIGLGTSNQQLTRTSMYSIGQVSAISRYSSLLPTRTAVACQVPQSSVLPAWHGGRRGALLSPLWGLMSLQSGVKAHKLSLGYLADTAAEQIVVSRPTPEIPGRLAETGRFRRA
jgi:hypothetical protein